MKATFMFFLIALFTFAIIPNVGAAEFEEQLNKLVDENAEGYIGPFATAFGTGMNSGLYHTGKVHGILGFDVGIKMSFVSISDEDLEYEFIVGDLVVDTPPGLVLGDTLTIDLTQVYPNRKAPTVFGSSGDDIEPTGAEAALESSLLEAGMTPAALEEFKGTAEWNTLMSQMQPIPGLFAIDFSTLLLVLPQASVGLPFNTEVMLRFLPTVDLKDIGEINFMGFGISHSLSQYIPIPLFPVAITAQFATQKLEIGNFLESNNTSFGVRASMTVGLGVTLTPYVGLGFESSDLKVDYTVDNPGNPFHGEEISLDLDENNSMRMTAGVRLGLPMMTFNVDYSLGEYSAISAGLGLTLR